MEFRRSNADVLDVESIATLTAARYTIHNFDQAASLSGFFIIFALFDRYLFQNEHGYWNDYYIRQGFYE